MEPAERFKKVVGVLGSERHTLSAGTPARIITNSVYARIPEKGGDAPGIVFKHLRHEYADSNARANPSAERRLVNSLEAIPGVSAGKGSEFTDEETQLVTRSVVATHEATFADLEKMRKSEHLTEVEKEKLRFIIRAAKNAKGEPGKNVHIGFL
ncbi:MAG: hypothetical protein WC792_00620 [Candidatus Micrarchaeia archaeon]|jgi:hypothetical protein